MAFEFTETLTIELPAVERDVSAFAEGHYRKDHGLIIEIAAIHEGMTANFNFYSAKALEDALLSWIMPYPKPIILHHDPSSEAIGRVMAAKMEQEADGTPYTMLQVAITDTEAIAKVLDQRYLTGSVGGRALEAKCSVCGSDWANASLHSLPCSHQRGKTYKGKLAYMEMGEMEFKEYSFVNMPADQRSNVRSISSAGVKEGGDESWVRSARIFSLDMNNPEILEFSESADAHNVLDDVSKRQASPFYMQLKGAFLSALAVSTIEESKKPDEEFDVTDNITQEEEEDILAVAEGLSSDLAAIDAEELAEEEAEEEAPENAEISEEEAVEDTGDEIVAEEEAEEEVVAVEEGDEAPEISNEADEDAPESSDDTAETREGDEPNEEVAAIEEEEAAESDDEIDLDALRLAALKMRVADLEAKELALLEENAKLKRALKHGLAERVVDMKVAMGIVEMENRDEELVKHVSRSASSLADSVRDLANMPKVVSERDLNAFPEIVEHSAALSGEGDFVINSNEPAAKEDKASPEDVLVEVLMGRRSI